MPTAVRIRLRLPAHLTRWYARSDGPRIAPHRRQRRPTRSPSRQVWESSGPPGRRPGRPGCARCGAATAPDGRRRNANVVKQLREARRHTDPRSRAELWSLHREPCHRFDVPARPIRRQDDTHVATPKSIVRGHGQRFCRTAGGLRQVPWHGIFFLWGGAYMLLPLSLSPLWAGTIVAKRRRPRYSARMAPGVGQDGRAPGALRRVAVLLRPRACRQPADRREQVVQVERLRDRGGGSHPLGDAPHLAGRR